MKKRKQSSLVKGILLLGIVIIIVIIINAGLQKKKENTAVYYSIRNNSTQGWSALYTTLKRTGLNVKEGFAPLSALKHEDCIIMLEDDAITEEEMRSWAKAGGMLVWIREPETLPQDSEYVVVEPVGEGMLVYVNNSRLLTNGSLKNATECAYELYKTLNQYAQHKQIIFNEYYLYGQDHRSPTLWQITPDYIKGILIQLLIGGILLIICSAKRLGKAKCLVTEVERQENEYLYSVSNIYRKSQAWDLVLVSFYEKLLHTLRQLNSSEDSLIEIWKEEKLPNLEMAQQVMAYMAPILTRNEIDSSVDFKETMHRDRRLKLKKKDALKIIEKLFYLMKIVNKRREEYWRC